MRENFVVALQKCKYISDQKIHWRASPIFVAQNQFIGWLTTSQWSYLLGMQSSSALMKLDVLLMIPCCSTALMWRQRWLCDGLHVSRWLRLWEDWGGRRRRRRWGQYPRSRDVLTDERAVFREPTLHITKQ